MPAKRIAIIGAGPIGIELAAALKLAGADYLHFEAGQIGSTIGWFAPGTTFFSSPERIAIADMPLEVPDQMKATREQYLDYLRGVVKYYDLHIRTYSRVLGIGRNNGQFVLDVAPSLEGVGVPEKRREPEQATERFACDAVVLAIGDMHLPNDLDIPGEALPFVSHYLDDPHRYFRQNVLIVGGRNSAVEAAIRLYRVGARITFSYRRAALPAEKIKYWLYPEFQGLVSSKKIRFLPQTVPIRIGQDGVAFAATNDYGLPALEKSEWQEQFDFVLLLTGYRQNTSLLECAGVCLVGDERKPQCNPETMETNVPLIFVAGTAAAGTQVGDVKEFIETSHVHVGRIAKALTGQEARMRLAGQVGALET